MTRRCFGVALVGLLAVAAGSPQAAGGSSQAAGAPAGIHLDASSYT